MVLAICICGLPDLIVKASTQRQEGPHMTLPKVRNAKADSSVIDNESIVLAIPSDDEFYIGNERIKKEGIRERIRDLLRDRRPDLQIIFIKSAAALKYSTVREVLNMIRDVGYDRVGLVVEKSNSQGDVIFDAMIYPIPFGAKADPRDILPPLPDPPQRIDPFPPPPPPPPPPARRGARSKRVYPQPTPMHMDSFVVELKTDGSGPEMTVALNSRVMALSELGPFLSNILDQSFDRTVFVKVPRDKMYDDLITVMDEVVGAGAITVGLILDEFELPRTLPRPARRPPVVSGGGVGGVPGGVPGRVPPPPPPPGARYETPKIIRKSGGVLQASATRRVEPEMPPMAKAANVTGAVVVEVTVDEDGNVIAARAISGHPLLKDAAVSAARGWKFTPTQLSGEPVKVIGTITFNFNE